MVIQIGQPNPFIRSKAQKVFDQMPGLPATANSVFNQQGSGGKRGYCWAKEEKETGKAPLEEAGEKDKTVEVKVKTLNVGTLIARLRLMDIVKEDIRGWCDRGREQNEMELNNLLW